MSNMGYLSTLLSPEARDKAGPKNGAVSMVTVNIDPLGAVSVTADVTVQGQGHETVLSQIVADQLGLRPNDVDVTLEMDTAKDQWSIAAGTYSCRFTPGTAVAAQMAASRMADKLKAIGAKQLNVLPDDVELAQGKIRSRSNPDNAMPFGRVAGTSHWSPVMLPEGMQPALSETAVWTPPELEPPSSDDRINTSLTYGFVFDMCGIEIDPITYQVRVDRYVSMHDAGKMLNPMIADGQMRGAFAQGIAAALYEEFVTNEEGAFLTGTFADYLVPTVSEIPPVEMLHQETPSPLTPLGAKGLAEGNCMSVPVCIANAVADALGVKDVRLPVTPRRIHELLGGEGGAMKPRPFDYVRPDTVDEAVAVLAEHGDGARVLAGGQSLIAMLNLRLVDPGMLIDIARMPELGAIRDLGDKIEVGAAVTQNQPAGVAGTCRQAAAARGRAAQCRPFPDPQQRHGVRLDRARRSQLRNSAVARGAGRRGGAALGPRHARACRRRFPARHALHRLRTRRADYRGALSGRAHARRGVPRSVAPPRRLRHHRGRRDGGRAGDRSARRRRHGGTPGGAAHSGRQRHGCDRATRDRARRLRGPARLGRDAARYSPPARTGGDCGGPKMRRVNRDQRTRIRLTLNGRAVSAESEPRMLLSDFLRQSLGATGTHVGCEHGICGCCTVMIDGTAVRSCLTLAMQAEGREVRTVESLAAADGKLNKLQQAFQNHHALQCGFCTPGILMSFTDYLARTEKPTEAELREVLSGHICRCTGYAGIMAALCEAAGVVPTDPNTRREP